MTTDTSMVARDLYLRHTGTDGKSFVQCHRVWDADLFLTTKAHEADEANAKVRDGKPRFATVEVITRDEYLAAR